MLMKCLHSLYQQTTLIGNLQPSLLFLVVMKCWVLKKPALQECVASCLRFTYTVKLLFPSKAEQVRVQDQKSIHWHPLHQVTPALLISHSFSKLIYSYRAKAPCNTETTNDNLTTSLYYLLSPTFSLNLCAVLYAKCPFSFLNLRAQMLILNFFKNISETVK